MIELHTPPTSTALADTEQGRDASVRTALSGLGGVRTRSFVDALQQASTETDTEKRLDAEARATAEEFVAVALVQPLLAQLRSSNNAWGPFKPGAHEKQFGAMLDAEYASRIARASGYPLVDSLARDLRRTTQHAPREEQPEAPRIDTDA